MILEILNTSQHYLQNSTEFPGYGGYLLTWCGLVATVITARVRQVTQAPRQTNIDTETVLRLTSTTFTGYWCYRPQTSPLQIQTTNNTSQSHLSIPWLFWDGFTWLGWGICAAAVILGKVDLRKSSSISRTLESKDLEEVSLMSSSFIFLAIMMVFLVIFSPGRPILRSQGSHWRKTTLTCSRTVRTWGMTFVKLEKFVCWQNKWPEREREREGDTHPVWHVVGVRHPVMIVEDHYRRPEHQQQYWGEEKHKTGQWTLNSH